LRSASRAASIASELLVAAFQGTSDIDLILVGVLVSVRG
jgi:hypothetical protein